MKQFLSTLFALSIYFNAFAQTTTPTLYTPIQCSGDIPADFLSTVKQRYIPKNAKDADEFQQENVYYQTQYLQSGLVIFNDSISQYVGRVFDKVLEKHPDLRGKLRLYLATDPYLNASMSDDGVTYINVGLLPYLENEAQLALILCHEASHYIKGHGQRLYSAFKKIDKKNKHKDLEGYDYNRMIFKKSAYSQDAEREADSLGLVLFLESGYSAGEAVKLFDAFNYAHLPIFNGNFDKSFFESGDYKFPDSYWIKGEEPIRGWDYIENRLELMRKQKANESDQIVKEIMQTHPKSGLRKAILMARIEDRKKGADFLVSETEFNRMKEMSRYEMARQLLLYKDFEQAFYHSYNMLQQHPGDPYFEKVMARALAGLSTNFNSGLYSDIHNPSYKVEGNYKKMCFLFENMAEYQQSITILAARFMYGMVKKYPQDNDYRLMCADLMKDIFFRFGYEPEDFYTHEGFEKALSYALSRDKRPDKDYTTANYQAAQPFIRRNDVPIYMFAAFEDYMNDAEFKKMLEEAAEKAVKKENKYTAAGQLSEKQKNSIGVRKLLILNPQFAYLDKYLEPSKNYLKAEQLRDKAFAQIEEAGRKANLKLSMVRSSELKTGDVSAFNDISCLNRFLLQRYRLSDDASFSSVDNWRIDSVMEKYNTRYVAMVSVYVVKPNPANLWWGAAALSVPPVGIYIMCSTGINTWYFGEIFDMETGEKVAKFDGNCPNSSLKAALKKQYKNLMKAPLAARIN